MKIRAACAIVTIALIFWAQTALADAPAPTIDVKLVTHGLRAPVFLISDGTPRLFVIEEAGRIRLIQNGQLLPTPFLDIKDKVTLDPNTHEAGMLCLAFNPHFAQNGKFYVFYMTGSRAAGTLTTIVSEFTASGPDAATVDRATERVIFKIHKDYLNHNGGMITFGPDGYLYIGLGDGGKEYDPYYRAQNTGDLMGKILRVDVDHQDSGLAYAIPSDNPFVGNAKYRPEIWAVGFRNPWRIGFDRLTNDLYCGEVGQDSYEEIDIVTKGGNYGWSIMEANHSMEGNHGHMVPSDPPPLIPPIKEYSHPAVAKKFPSNVIGKCIIGGYVYRGKQFPAMDGWYIYGDYAASWIAGLKYENGKITGDQKLLQTKFPMSSFGEDANGELYVCDWTFGNIYQVVAK